MVKTLLIVYGILISFILYKKLCIYGNNKNECGCNINVIHFYNIVFHLHHWIIHLLLLLLSNNIIKYNNIKYLYIGLNIGGIIHGLITYNDWYNIIYFNKK